MIEIVLFVSTIQLSNVSTSLANSERFFVPLAPADRRHRHGGKDRGHRKGHRTGDGPGHGEFHDPVIRLHPDQPVGARPDHSACLLQRRPQLQQRVARPLQINFQHSHLRLLHYNTRERGNTGTQVNVLLPCSSPPPRCDRCPELIFRVPAFPCSRIPVIFLMTCGLFNLVSSRYSRYRCRSPLTSARCRGSRTSRASTSGWLCRRYPIARSAPADAITASGSRGRSASHSTPPSAWLKAAPLRTGFPHT